MRQWRSPLGPGAHAHPSRAVQHRTALRPSPSRHLETLRQQRQHGRRQFDGQSYHAETISRQTSTNNEPLEWPATTADNAVDAGTQSDAALDDALRALARLLARQAAREIFDRACAQEVKPEDLQ
jgi:hypothetical protein